MEHLMVNESKSTGHPGCSNHSHKGKHTPVVSSCYEGLIKPGVDYKRGNPLLALVVRNTKGE